MKIIEYIKEMRSQAIEDKKDIPINTSYSGICEGVIEACDRLLEAIEDGEIEAVKE